MKKIYCILFAVIMLVCESKKESRTYAEEYNFKYPGEFIEQEIKVTSFDRDLPTLSYKEYLEAEKDIVALQEEILQEYLRKKDTGRMYTNSTMKSENKIQEIEERLERKGVKKMSNEEAGRYVSNIEGGVHISSELASISNSPVTYPDVQGINFYYAEVSYGGEKFIRVNALADPKYASKLVTEYQSTWVSSKEEMNNFAKKTINIVTSGATSYILSKVKAGTIITSLAELWKGWNNLCPEIGASPSGKKLYLLATANTRIVHIWKKINGEYHFKVAMNAATINELWSRTNNSGGIETFQYSYNIESSNLKDILKYASSVSLTYSENCYLRYKIKGMSSKNCAIEPPHAPLPIHFSELK